MASDVVLRAVVAEDLPLFFAHQQDPDANRMAGFPPRERAPLDAHWDRLLADATCVARTIVEPIMTDVLFVQGAGEGVHDGWDLRLVERLRHELGPGYDVRWGSA